MSIDAVPPSVRRQRLLDTGSRFDHLNDLLDIWSDGVEVVKASYKAFPNDKDKLRLAQLEAAVLLLKKQIDLMADWNNKQWGLRDEINKIPRLPRVKEETIGSKTKDEKTQTPEAVGETRVAKSTEEGEEGETTAV